MTKNILAIPFVLVSFGACADDKTPAPQPIPIPQVNAAEVNQMVSSQLGTCMTSLMFAQASNNALQRAIDQYNASIKPKLPTPEKK